MKKNQVSFISFLLLLVGAIFVYDNILSLVPFQVMLLLAVFGIIYSFKQRLFLNKILQFFLGLSSIISIILFFILSDNNWFLSLFISFSIIIIVVKFGESLKNFKPFDRG